MCGSWFVDAGGSAELCILQEWRFGIMTAVWRCHCANNQIKRLRQIRQSLTYYDWMSNNCRTSVMLRVRRIYTVFFGFSQVGRGLKWADVERANGKISDMLPGKQNILRIWKLKADLLLKISRNTKVGQRISWKYANEGRYSTLILWRLDIHTRTDKI